MTARVTLSLTVTVRSPFLFPGLASGTLGVDAVPLRDESGRALLPATQVQGLLREALNDLAEAAPGVITPAEVERLFGVASPAAGPDSGFDQPKRGRLLLGDLSAEITPAGDVIRVEIDDVTGAARTGHIQVIEGVAPFGAEIAFRGGAVLFWPEAEAAKITKAIGCALQLIPAIGAFKSAGFGEVVGEATKVIETDRAELRVPARAADPGAQIHLSAVFDRPFLVDARRVADNAFIGAQVVPGAVFKGALARKLELSGANLADYESVLAHMVISHAHPENDAGGAGGEALPLSLVAVKTTQGDLRFGDALRPAGADTPPGPQIGGQAALFQSDWKPAWPAEAARALKLPGFTPLPMLPRTHTAIGAAGVAADQQLFTTVARSPRGRFLLRIDLAGVANDEKAWQLVALLRAGLDGIGRTGASVSFPDASVKPPDLQVSPAWGHANVYAVVLRTDAVLTDPRTHHDADAAYRHYWHTVAGAELIDFYAAQHLAGGYLATRYRPWGRDTYHPFVVTDAGSVFLLRGDIAGRLRQFTRSGLPLPEFEGVEKLNWRNCPFVPENGYAAIRANHLSDRAAAETLLGCVTHV